MITYFASGAESKQRAKVDLINKVGASAGSLTL
jgi:hypothetical protein